MGTTTRLIHSFTYNAKHRVSHSLQRQCIGARCLSSLQTVSLARDDQRIHRFTPSKQHLTMHNNFFLPTRRQHHAFSSFRLFSSTAAADDSFFATEVDSFESMGIQSPILLERLKKIGLETPTQVQAKSFATVREGTSDVTIGAETGSGKTLSYLLPLLDDILQQKQAIANGEGSSLS